MYFLKKVLFVFILIFSLLFLTSCKSRLNDNKLIIDFLYYELDDNVLNYTVIITNKTGDDFVRLDNFKIESYVDDMKVIDAYFSSIDAKLENGKSDEWVLMFDSSSFYYDFFYSMSGMQFDIYSQYSYDVVR